MTLCVTRKRKHSHKNESDLYRTSSERSEWMKRGQGEFKKKKNYARSMSVNADLEKGCMISANLLISLSFVCSSTNNVMVKPVSDSETRFWKVSHLSSYRWMVWLSGELEHIKEVNAEIFIIPGNPSLWSSPISIQQGFSTRVPGNLGSAWDFKKLFIKWSK